MNKFLLILILLFAAVFGQAQNKSNQLKSEQQKLQKKIASTKSLIQATRSSKQLTMTELAIINNQIAYREELISNIGYQLKKTDDNIVHLTQEISIQEANLTQLKSDYGKMLRYAYKHRNTDIELLYIFSASSFSQAYKRMKYIKTYAAYREKQAKRIKSSQIRLQEKIEELEGIKTEQAELATSKQNEAVAFKKDQDAQKIALTKILQDENKLKSQLLAQQTKKNKLNSEIRNAIAKELAAARKAEIEAAKKANKTSTTTSSKGFTLTPEIKLASKNFESNKGKLPWPVKTGEITGKFGKHQHDVVKTAYVENNGIDISTTKSSKVRAVFGGKVTSVIVIPGAGKVVMIKHGSYRSVYSNLEIASVKKGDNITIKQEIGQLLADGSVSKAHFEIWKINADGTMAKQNPAYWLYKK